MTASELMAKANNLSPKLTEIYQCLHQIPELAFEEYKTAETLAEILGREGFSQVRTGVGDTGIEVCIGAGAPEVALRADMDALPVLEETGLPYASKHQGRMHACGHDAHMAVVLGAGILLKEQLENIKSGIKLIFQPAEETPPGGARSMIAAGVLNKELKAIVALHSHPYLPAGIVCLKEGPIMAAADMFSLEIIGKGGHGALPHQTRDTVMIGSLVVQGLQTIVSRTVDPLEPAVVTVGSFHAGTKSNIIPGKARLEGTVRTINAELRKKMPGLMEKIIAGICSSHDTEYKFDYQWGYPPVINDRNLVKVVEKAAQKIVGQTKTFYADRPSMGGEDFSYYLEQVPGVFFYLGVGAADINKRHPWHHPAFQVDAGALPAGAAVLAQAALDIIGG